MGADKIPGGPMRKFQYHGYFEMTKLYGEMKDLFELNRNYDITEKYYVEKAEGGNRELKAYYDGELHYTDYYQLVIILKVAFKGKDVEVEINGRKKIMTQGTIKVIASRYIEVDFQNKRARNPLMEFVTKVYDKYFGTDEISDCVQTMGRDIEALKSLIKNHVMLVDDLEVPSI